MLVAKLGRFVTHTKHVQNIPPELKETLERLLERVQSSQPVEVSTKIFSTWICFTDGACEDKATVGAVLVNPLGSAVCAFGAELPCDLQALFYKESKHPIYEVELLPVLLSLMIWGSQLRQCQVVYYLDNEAAKAGLIKGSGATRLADVIVGNFCANESKLELKTWFSRVPTHSNLSDGPSRMNFDLVITLGCALHQVPWHEVSGFMFPRLS